MKRTLIWSSLLIIAVSLVSGFVLSRSHQHMMIRIHVKDLPEEGLTFLEPSDPSFGARFSEQMKGESNSAIDTLKPYSVFFQNRSQRTVVAYMIQWCFTKTDGKTRCYRTAFSAPRALMEGEHLPQEVEAKTGKILPNSAILLSLLSSDNTGEFRVPIPSSHDEAAKMRQGLKLDQNDLLQRAKSELGKYTDVTISIDGAFFEDGTFVGENTSGFFEQIEAQIAAKRDVLNEISLKLSEQLKPRKEVFDHIEGIANQPVESLTPKSTADDHYRYYRQYYAKQILSSRQRFADEQALEFALLPSKQTWRTLTKKRSGNQ